MFSTPKRHPAIPVALSVAMVLIVVAAALLPNTGVVAAQSNCQYSPCPTTSGGGSPTMWYIALGVLLLIAAALAGLLLMRRRSRGGGGDAGPVEPWSGTDAGATVEGAPGAGEVEPPVTPSSAPSIPPSAGSAYL